MKRPIHALALLPLLAPAAAAQEEGVVLSAEGVNSLTIGGSARIRVESRDPLPPVKNARTQNLHLARVRVHLDAQIDDVFGAYVQFQESIGGAGTASVSSLHQAYASIDGIVDGMLDSKIGRMELQYGNQRMVSPLDWDNTARAWDGVLVVRRGEGFQLDLFATQPVAAPHVSSATGNDDFLGAYAEIDIGELDLDAYVLKRRLSAVPDFEDITYGALLEGVADAVAWSIEAAFQSGDHGTFGATTVSAGGMALAARADYTFENGARLGAGYELASGASGGDDRFVPLFDFGHYYQGFADIVQWSNLQDIVVRAMVPVHDDWNVHGDLHLLSRAESSDVVIFAAGAAGAATAAGGASDIGTEIDLYLKGKLAADVDTWIGVSQFLAGDAIFNGDDQLWAFAQLVFWF